MSWEEQEKKDEIKTVRVQGPTPTFGIVGFVFGLISIFALSVLLVPIAIIFAIISFNKEEEHIWAIIALICAGIGLLTSPTLLLLIVAILP